jgi:hypothetical protein
MAGWFDNTHLVVNRYVPAVAVGQFDFDHVEVIGTTGTTQSSLNIPEVSDIRPAGANSFYAPNRNVIYDASNGNALWTSAAPSRGVGAVSGSHVVFASGATVRIESR